MTLTDFLIRPFNIILHCRKTITSQKVIAIKKTNQIMLESVAKELAYPTMTCPVTGKKFHMSEVVQVAQIASGFASTGSVEAKKYRPSMN
jgi:nitric oxide synthase-interacting protein